MGTLPGNTDKDTRDEDLLELSVIQTARCGTRVLGVHAGMYPTLWFAACVNSIPDKHPSPFLFKKAMYPSFLYLNIIHEH